MRRDGNDEGGAAEEEAVGPACERGKNGLGSDAGVADEFVDLDDEGHRPQDARDESGGEEKEGVALEDEAAIVSAGEAEVPEESGDVVEELEQLEERRTG